MSRKAIPNSNYWILENIPNLKIDYYLLKIKLLNMKNHRMLISVHYFTIIVIKALLNDTLKGILYVIRLLTQKNNNPLKFSKFLGALLSRRYA